MVMILSNSAKPVWFREAPTVGLGSACKLVQAVTRTIIAIRITDKRLVTVSNITHILLGSIEWVSLPNLRFSRHFISGGQDGQDYIKHPFHLQMKGENPVSQHNGYRIFLMFLFLFVQHVKENID
jgi:hypothetical protein